MSRVEMKVLELFSLMVSKGCLDLSVNQRKENRVTRRRIKNFGIILTKMVIIFGIICFRASDWQDTFAEIEKKEAKQNKDMSQDILDRFEDYVFDKNYILHFPSGESLSFEKGVNDTNNSPQARFSPDGKYIAYTYGNVARGNDLKIYDFINKKTNTIEGTHRLIKDLNWFSFRERLYLLYNTFSTGRYGDVWFFIFSLETDRQAVLKPDWSFVDFLPSGDGFRYEILEPGEKVITHHTAKFEDLLLFDVLMIPPKQAEQIIARRANDLILVLKNKDMEKLSQFIHPDKGVRLSPYSYVNTCRDLVFTSQEIKNIFADTTRYIWGTYDGSGLPIELTFREYFKKFIYDKDFAKAKEVGYNRIIETGTLNNNFETYPGSIIVEYHFPGFDPKSEGFDWESLRLVFENKGDSWYLVAIIHDQWMI